MKSTRIYLSITLLVGFILLFTQKNHAQDTMRIDVIKPFIATLSDAMKIQSSPNPEVPMVTKDSFTYESPEIIKQDIPTVYTIKPLSLGTSLLPKLKSNYFRIGYGNYNSPLAEMYLNTTRNRNTQAGIYVKHFSSNPSDNRSFSTNNISAYGKKFVDKGIIDGEINYNRNAYNLYGYQFDKSNVIQNAPKPPSIDNTFGLFELKAGYANVVKDTSKLGYAIKVKYNHMATSYKFSENDFVLSGNFHKSVQGNPLDVYTAVQTNTITADTGTKTDYGRTFIDINPTYKLRMDKGYLMLGFNSTFFTDNKGTQFHFFPKAEIGYGIIANALTAYAGIRGDLKRHTLRSIATENPFVRSMILNNTVNQFEMYAGLKGIISPQTSFVLEASLSSVKNLLFYAADSLTASQTMVYDGSTASLTNLKAELNHEFGEQFRFGFAMNYYHYSLSINAPYSRPTFTTSLNILYAMGNKFYLRSEIYTMNQRIGQFINTTTGDKRNVTMDGLVDLNLGMDYRYNKNVKVFLNVNNLTNNQYQRWTNMPVFGINVIGGLGITF